MLASKLLQAAWTQCNGQRTLKPRKERREAEFARMTESLSVLPIAVLVAALAVFKAPAWKAALLAYFSGAALAHFGAHLGVAEIAGASLQGVGTGLYPIGLVIIAALFTYAVTVESKAIEEIKGGLCSLSADTRFQALLVAWGFGNFMEGMAGFGTAVAIPCAILVGVGFDPVKAVLCCLVANTTPTAFGSVGVPTMVLSGETGLGLGRLAATIGAVQTLPTVLSPFLVLLIADGRRGLREKWRLALLADAAFVLPWLAVSLLGGCELPDIVGGICAMVALGLAGDRSGLDARRQARAWMPFVFVVAALAANAMLPARLKLSPGVLILAAGFAGGLYQGLRARRLAALLGCTLRKYSLALLTVCTILALAKTMGAAGMTEALADALAAATGSGYAAVASLVGALGGFVTGSGTSSNVLFGAMQAAAGGTEAEKFLFAAANVMGAGIGKMVCPQSIVLGCAAAGLAGRESDILKKALPFFAIALAAACTAVVVFARL